MFSIKRQFGNKGEDEVVKDLKKSGFRIVARNYLKKWGEIDIIALKDKILYFYEVKTVSKSKYETGYRPEDNVSNLKLKKMGRTIETFLLENEDLLPHEWTCNVACVYMPDGGVCEIEYMKDIII
jgi:putative endonuclease